MKNQINGSTSIGLKIVIFTYVQRDFFVVQFDNKKNLEYVINEGSWFWGRACLFVNPWFPSFNATTMVVRNMSIWLRLYNIALPL